MRAERVTIVGQGIAGSMLAWACERAGQGFLIFDGGHAQAGRDGTDYILLVKPQFEVGREAVGAGGIVRDPVAHRGGIAAVAE